ncbi:hypothetical protein JAO73_20345 [Hymenobacter sp. BT523]|uniref:hypothetical protein n=1 Tax=Hymenobacter sp. BT523 TaxID=2795725 RepID=UPI0018EC6723|nr:hypothetical protein [Hymenobacter sp. BT523]MBJ6111382.1 hypothetical protein [Hymenobacter sp. BT523]
MTDREPDDLYDALRRRLADHGQEPPAPLWANIRAQLPPPVAAPQLRKRRHKRTAAALLLLLLAVVGTAGWQWWRVGQRRELAQQAARRADQQNQLATLQPGTAPAPGAARSGSASEGPVAGVAPASGAASFSAPASATPAVAAAGEAAPGATTPRNAVAGNGTGLVSGPSSTGAAVASGAITAASRPAVKTATGRTEGIAMVGRSARKGRFAAVLAKPGAGDQEAASAARPGQAWRPVNAAAVTVAAVAPRGAVSGAGRMNDNGATPVNQSGLASGEIGGTQAAAVAGMSSSEAASSTWTGPLASRRAVLSPVEMAALRLALPADTLPRLPAVPVRRWAVQVVGGPAYTYRHLSQSNDLASNALSSPTPNTIRSYDTAGNVREQQEQAGTGLALALQVRRVLSGRWSLSTGLGYQEYALQRTYDEVKAITSSIPPVVVSNPRPPITTYVFTQSTYRDTYRFLTVPVRLSYVLGATKKISYAFSGGADAAFYLGGNSAGSDAARHAWGPSADGPNRALNLSLSGGLDVRYRVASRLELLAQPSATYFLSSLAKPVSGLTPRHLLGAGVLLGVSYDWR